MHMLAMVCMVLSQGTGGLPAWEFNSEEDLKAWAPNAHLAHVVLKDRVVSADAVDWDPFFLCRGIAFEARPWQHVLLRIRASRSGACDLFWSGELEGQYGGLTEKKKVRFSVAGDGQWHEVAVFPFWHPEGTIRQLRLDVYNDAHFDLDWIRILEWGGGQRPLTGVYAWEFEGDTSPWQIHPGAAELFAPPCRLTVADKGWVTVTMQSPREAVATVLWACEGEAGMQTADFVTHSDGKMHSYSLELDGMPAWRDPVVAFGIRLLAGPDVRLDSIRIGDEPLGPAEIEVAYFGFENAPNRAGAPCRLLAQITNRGGKPGGLRSIGLFLPRGVRLVSSPESLALAGLERGELAEFVWEVRAEAPGTYEVSLDFGVQGAPEPVKTPLRFSDPVKMAKAEYVPAPHPVETDLEVCAFYFPGWDSSAKWDCIRRIAPVRKPVLGYYDERNPECVDWQIKWAVENGVSCFLVDWYWIGGNQMLTHWFEAYRKARYRDDLKVAIMWANHNPPNTHSPEDWRNVTREWIGRYFNLPSYYRIDGKPAVFIWNPQGIRQDLGGTEAVKKSFDESQAMARAAGYAGITFAAMGYDFATSNLNALKEEGYVGVTTYHEWGEAENLASAMRRARFEDTVQTAPLAWERNDRAAGSLTYYPVVETGWDSRPWHGDKSLVIAGRTPELFEQLLRQAKTFCVEKGKPIAVLGPVNEWGEGSYIEPCTEYGFDMLEVVRRVFGKGDPATWPVNIAPSDVGGGPYDFPKQPQVTSWSFDKDAGGWRAMMNVADPRCANGALHFRTVSDDPALTVDTRGLRAAQFSKVLVRMQLTGPVRDGSVGQLFWSRGGSAMTKATTIRFPLKTDGAMHTYTLDVADNPRWRGAIATLRFDPCESTGVEVAVDEFKFVEKML